MVFPPTTPAPPITFSFRLEQIELPIRSPRGLQPFQNQSEPAEAATAQRHPAKQLAPRIGQYGCLCGRLAEAAASCERALPRAG